MSVVVCILFFSVAFALTIDGELDSNVILKEYGNSLNLHLEVVDAEDGIYNVYTLNDVNIFPGDIFYENKSAFERDFDITPMDRLLDSEGIYVLSYFLNQRGVTQVNQKLELQIISVSELFEIVTDDVPLDANFVYVNLNNKYNVALSNLSISLSSILFDFSEVIEVEPMGNVVFKIPIDNKELRKINAGSYIIDVMYDTPKGKVSTTGRLKLSVEEGINTQEDTNGVFVRTTIINKVNTGNVNQNVHIEIEKNIFTRFFTSFNVEPISEVREGSAVTYFWSKKIGPSEEFTVKATTNNFFPVLLIIALIIVFNLLKKVFATKLLIEKSVTPIKTKNGEFALRVYLNVKAKRDLENVVLIDRIPKTVKIYRKFGNSTPDEIDATNRRLKWELGEMASGDERTFTYIVYSRVGYVGRFVLPSALSRFLLGEKIYQVESNSVFFLAEQSSEMD